MNGGLAALAMWLICGAAPAEPPAAAAPAGRRLAQAFDLPAAEDEAAADPAEKKKKKKKEAIDSETDLWSMPEPDAPDEQPEVEPVDPDLIEDIDPQPEPSGPAAAGRDGRQELGGWGAAVERDSWGDEDRIDDSPLPQARPEPPDRPQPAAPTPELDPDPDAAAAADAGDQPAPDAPADTAGAEPAAAAAEAVVPQEGVVPLSGSPADLARLWQQRRIHLEQRDFELARQDLERILSLREELAIANLELPALVLLREARRAEQREDAERAARLLAAAVTLAPDLAEVHLARAGYTFRNDPLALGQLAGGLAAAAGAALDNPLSRDRLLVNALFSLLIGLALAAAVFTLAGLLRYLRLFIHDFHHLFPRGVALFQTGLLAILVLLLPILFRSGLVLVLMTWLLVAWIYQSWRERALTLVVLAVFATAPLVLQLAVERMQRPLTTYGDAVDVLYGAGRADSLRRLKMQLAEQPDNPVLLAALGSHYKRIGQLEQAEDYYRRAVRIEDNSVVLLNNLGNVLFLQNDVAAAQAHYQRATKIRPDEVVPYFNLSRAYFRAADLDKGKETVNQAIRIDQHTVRRLRQQADKRLFNTAVADLRLPADWLGRLDGHGGPRSDRVLANLWRSTAGTPSVRYQWVASGVAVGLLLLLLWLRARVFVSNGCVRCGRPACRRCSPELRDDSMCGQCFHAFVKKSKVDARSRIAKEIQIRKHRRRTETFARAVAFVVPGLAQLVKGRSLRGGLILLVACLALGLVLASGQIVRDPHDLGGGRNWLLLAAPLIVFAGFYVWGILDAFRADDY
jgi:tetratricopeptide (TPR) repeat protein